MGAARSTAAQRDRGEDRVPIGAKAEERDVTEIEQARPSNRDVEPHRQQRVQQAVERDRLDVHVGGRF